ncbi:hypothetical protein [Pseudomonas sp. S2_F03]|jgi:hypothetical protein
MNSVEITIAKNGKRQTAELLCDSENLTITIIMKDGYQKSYTGDDFYKCLGNVRRDHPDIIFMCKGAKINVHPSTMSSQMTLGVKAYELTLGKRALLGDIVNIFDYEESNLTNNPDLQEDFFIRWYESDPIKE